MIIFEGPDGAGKSTAIEGVAKEFNLNKLAKAVNSDQSRAIDPSAYINEVLHPDIACQPWLLDRFWLISGSIYGPVMGVGSQYSHTNAELADPGWAQLQWRKWRDRAMEGQLFVVWCLPPFGTVIRNLRDDVDTPHVVKDHISLIYRLYHVWAVREQALDPDHHFVRDYTQPGNEELLHAFVAQAVRRHRAHLARVPAHRQESN